MRGRRTVIPSSPSSKYPPPPPPSLIRSGEADGGMIYEDDGATFSAPEARDTLMLHLHPGRARLLRARPAEPAEPAEPAAPAPAPAPPVASVAVPPPPDRDALIA
eukprot:4947660-Pyramimonas_sp.AAC.1